MKSNLYKQFSALTSLLVLLLSTVSFGADEFYDEFTGVYMSKDSKTLAQVKKHLISEGDLFTPSTYTYSLSVEDLNDPNSNTEMSLNYDANANTLTGEEEGYCDDPGCLELRSDVHISVKGSEKVLTRDYEWVVSPESDEEDVIEGVGSQLLTRLYKGTEKSLEILEEVRSGEVKGKVYASLFEAVKRISSNGDISLAGDIEESLSSVYKKVYLGKKVEALFVETTTYYLPKGANERYEAQCFSLIVKEKSWDVKHSTCWSGYSEDRKDWL